MKAIFCTCNVKWRIFFNADNYGRGMRMDMSRGDGNKRRLPRNDPEPPSKNTPPPAQPAPATSTRTDTEIDDKPIPDDLSEISDDPDDILNREDVSCVMVIKLFVLILLHY